jgi:16S rRNA A1518/A1519 N6-dimethyltransferase RsmA/KsgA/DIM1 with predicted DNA glycosylase/AP lyase activity
MSDSRFPTIGPGKMDVCQKCVEHLKHEIDHRIADELEQHPEILNGHIWLRDMLKLRRGQHNQEIIRESQSLGSVEELQAVVYPEAKHDG